MKKKPLKVLQIVRIPSGGIRKHILSIVHSAIAQDFDFYLCSDISRADEAYKKAPVDSSKVFSLEIPDAPGPKDLPTFWKIYRHYKNQKIDLIHGHGAKGGLYARMLGFMLGAKVVYTAHGGSLHTMHGLIKNRLYQVIEEILYYFTDCLMFESRYSLESYIKRVRHPKSKASLIYNGTAVANTMPKRDFPLPPYTIGAFGLLRKIKGHDLLIQAIALLRKEGLEVQGFISGHGEEEENLKQLAKSLGVEFAIKIQTDTQDIQTEMQRCAIIVQPSHFESFGYVPIEAQSLGIPVVATDRGGLKEVVLDRETGLSCKLDARDLADKIKELLFNQELRERITVKAFERVRSEFNEEVMVERILKQYQQLVEVTK